MPGVGLEVEYLSVGSPHHDHEQGHLHAAGTDRGGGHGERASVAGGGADASLELFVVVTVELGLVDGFLDLIDGHQAVVDLIGLCNAHGSLLVESNRFDYKR